MLSFFKKQNKWKHSKCAVNESNRKYYGHVNKGKIFHSFKNNKEFSCIMIYKYHVLNIIYNEK